MSSPILPARPLRLRASFVVGAWLRAAAALAPALAVIAAACVWQARAAWEIADDRRGWDEGATVELLASQRDERVLFGVVRDVVVSARYVDREGVVRSGAMRWLALLDGGTAGPLSARVDPVRGRLVLSWAVDAAPWRWAWALAAALLLAGLLAACALAARSLLRELTVARRAARASDEVELEVIELVSHDVHGKPSVLEVRYRAPEAGDAPTGYRESARRASDEVRRARFRLADGRPILLDGGVRVLALRAHGSSLVTVVRDDLWPFAASASDVARARARAGERQPEPASSEASAPPSGIGTHLPSSPNT